MKRSLPFAPLLLAVLSACGDSGRAPPESAPNVLLIAVDTLRADLLGCYGSELGLTPEIDALAARGVRFAAAHAHAPWTLPSFATMFTSQTPLEHGAGGRLGAFRPLAPSAETLAERFAEAGWETAAVTNVPFLSEAFGTLQGFAHTDVALHETNSAVRPAQETTDAAIDWLRRPRRAPFLMLVHYFDPHLVYDPPPEYRRRLADPRDREDASWVFGTREDMSLWRSGRRELERTSVERARLLHLGEVAYADAEVGRLLDALAALDLERSTVVAFTSDHGEEFWDHGGFEHGHSLYEELLRVPLILAWPGRLEPTVVERPVGHVDLAPTLCRLAGLERAPGFRGHDLLAPGERAPALLAHGNFWGEPLASWRAGEWKLIRRPGGEDELYRLDEDPSELDDRAAREPERARRMAAELDALLAAARAGTAAALPPELRAQLGELGYFDPDADGR